MTKDCLMNLALESVEQQFIENRNFAEEKTLNQATMVSRWNGHFEEVRKCKKSPIISKKNF